jgi:hypothetical protein
MESVPRDRRLSAGKNRGPARRYRASEACKASAGAEGGDEGAEGRAFRFERGNGTTQGKSGLRRGLRTLVSTTRGVNELKEWKLDECAMQQLQMHTSLRSPHRIPHNYMHAHLESCHAVNPSSG